MRVLVRRGAAQAACLTCHSKSVATGGLVLETYDTVMTGGKDGPVVISGNPDGSLQRPEVYLDETFVNKNHSGQFTWYLEEDGPWVNKPSGKGPRLIMVHAMTVAGWVPGAALVFEATKRTGDYHGHMHWEHFSTWFAE